ncbi:hypothetical protein PG987_011703 [Apiospora arundinis]
MVVVAVAGGTGAVGRTMVKAMVGSGHHMVYVLSRTVSIFTSLSVLVQTWLAVAATANSRNVCSSITAVSSRLRPRFDVIASKLWCLLCSWSTSRLPSRRCASSAVLLSSGTVTKFIPSEFHLDFHAPIQGIDLFMKKFQLESERELERQPHLTWTLIRNGLFLDYLGTPFQPKAKPTELMRWCIFVDLENEVCVFPGDGTKVMTFTHSSDLAAYVERMISLPAKNWPRHSLIKANRLEIKDLAGIVAKVTGG